MKYCLAIDIGASSGRHIVGWTENGAIRTEEVYRFPNGFTEADGHLTWDLGALTDHVKKGTDIALERFPALESLSLDTWGVDYVLMNGDTEILPCYAYRDSRTEAVIPRVHARVPFAELYRRTGIQFEPFNTVYQLSADLEAGRLEQATDFLLMPEYLMYKLTGVKAHEYTDATTGGLVNTRTGEFDTELIRALGLPERLFRPLQRPGTVLGTYRGVKVMLCATHDTASAVEGIPMTEGPAPYISSGTWSLLGMRVPEAITDERSLAGNWSNEGGPGYIRYQKNIMGMWLINSLRDELCPGEDFGRIVAMAEESRYDAVTDVNADRFFAPASMKKAFEETLGEAPGSPGDYFRCAYRSLARCYADALAELRTNTGAQFDRLYIVGGGAKNAFLNRLTEEMSGLRVIALPIEATALGNLKTQMEAET